MSTKDESVGNISSVTEEGDGIKKQLMQLKPILKQFGIMHEAQVMQVKLWPYAVDPKLETSVAEVDIEGAVLSYKWNSAFINPDKPYFERLTELQNTVKMFFGSEWELKVLLNGNPIFPVTKEKPPKKAKKKNVKSARKKRRASTVPRRTRK